MAHCDLRNLKDLALRKNSKHADTAVPDHGRAAAVAEALGVQHAVRYVLALPRLPPTLSDGKCKLLS